MPSAPESRSAPSPGAAARPQRVANAARRQGDPPYGVTRPLTEPCELRSKKAAILGNGPKRRFTAPQPQLRWHGAVRGAGAARGGASGTEAVRADGAAPRGEEWRGREKERAGAAAGLCTRSLLATHLLPGLPFHHICRAGTGSIKVALGCRRRARRGRNARSCCPAPPPGPRESSRPRRAGHRSGPSPAGTAHARGPAEPGRVARPPSAAPRVGREPGPARRRPPLRRAHGGGPARPAPGPGPAPSRGPAGAQRAVPEPRGAASCRGGPARLTRCGPPLGPAPTLQI